MEKLPPLQPKSALLTAQSWGSCVLVQELQAPVAERDDQRGAGSRNHMVGAGLPEAENLWREWGHHPASTTTLWERSRVKFYLKQLEVLTGVASPDQERLCGFGGGELVETRSIWDWCYSLGTTQKLFLKES